MSLSNSMMNAAVFYGANDLVIEEVPLKIGLNDASIKVDACAVCGYDARIYRFGHKKVKSPVILGHEICGSLTHNLQTPSGLIRTGARVAISPVIPCLKCGYCKGQQYNLCSNLKELGSSVDGGFAEYVKIPPQIIKIGGLVPVPDCLSDGEAALLEPLACCLNGCSRMGEVEKDGHVVILGDGPIGLIHLQLYKMLYGVKTIVVSKIPQRAKMAESMGADAVFMFDDKAGDEVMKFTGAGANLVVVATSNPEALGFVPKIAGKNSKVNLFAGTSGGSTSLDPNWIHYNQISITGSFSSTPDMLRKAAKLASERTVDLSKIVTHQYSLQNIKEAILTTEKFLGLRTIIDRF